MKKKWLLVCLLASLFAVTGCGKKDMSGNDISNNGVNEEIKENGNSKTETLAGLYPGADKLVEIPMGTYSDSGQKDYCTVMIPSNYMGGAVSSLNLSKDKSFEMFNGNDVVSTALENGWLETEYSISWMILSSRDGGYAEVYFNMLTKEEATYEAVKNMNIDYKEIGTSENPALYYVDSKAMGDMRLVYSVNPDIMLVIDYSGPLYDELGIEKIAQNLYNVVKVIK